MSDLRKMAWVCTCVVAALVFNLIAAIYENIPQ